MGKKEPFGYEDAARASDLVAKEVVAANLDPSQIRDGLILGSGLGSFPETHMDPDAVSLDFDAIYRAAFGIREHHDSVPGHARKLIIGALNEDPNGGLVIAQSGREHPYEGFPTRRSVFWVRVMQLLGVKTLIGSTATGILTPKTLRPPALMVVHSDQNLGNDNPLIGKNDERFGPRFPHMSDLYPKATRDLVKKAIANIGATEVPEGTYVRLKGPTYERREDVYSLRAMVKGIWEEGRNQKGEDRFNGEPVAVVGMSTVFEQIAAQHATQSKDHPAFLGGRAVIAVATNYSGSAGENGFVKPDNHEQVKEMAAQVEGRLGKIIKETMLEMRRQASERKKAK